MSTPKFVAVKAKTSVFISYSRKDTAFAQKLRDALEERHFAAYLDTKDILPGEDWRARLEGLILGADAVVFVISPDSVARWDLPPPEESICAWEIRRTVELKKQLMPVVWRALGRATIPPELRKPHWVSFEAYEHSAMADDVAFATSLDKLETALGVGDVLWVREHTKWVSRAVEWDKAEPPRPEGKLLRLADIAAVEAWTRLKPASAPEVPQVLSDYLVASVAKEEKDREELDARERRISAGLQKLVAEAALRRREAYGYDGAMRIAIAAEPSEMERARGATSEPRRHAELAAAAHAALGIARLWGHSRRVTSALFSPDGSRVITGSDDKTARVWDAQTGVELARLDHSEENVKRVAFSPDGSRVVTASNDETVPIWEVTGTVRVWDAATGTELYRLRHDGGVSNATFSPDGTRVVTASSDKTARVWDAAIGTELYRLRHDGGVSNATFSPDGTRVVTASSDKTARVWDAATGTELYRLRHDGGVSDAIFSPDGTRVATNLGTMALVWDVANRAEIARLDHGWIDGVAFSPDGTRVVTASNDKTARVWDAATGTELYRLRHDEWVNDAAFSPDGARVVTASADGTARVWDADNGVELARLGHDNSVVSAVFSADGGRLVTASWNGVAWVWDAGAGAELARLEHGVTVQNAVFSPDGAWVVTASADGMDRVWDSATGSEIARLDHGGAVKAAAFSGDWARVVTTSFAKTDVVPATARTEIVSRVHDGDVNKATFSPDGARVVTASTDGTARVWHAETGVELARLDHADEVNSATFSPDGTRVVTASNDKTARLWDADTGVELARFHHDHSVGSAVFSADATRLVTASSDNTARVWDVMWVARLTGDRLVRAVARERLKGAGQLTQEERRTLRPILGDIGPDVVSRWLAPSSDDEDIERTLAQWRGRRQVAFALAKKRWVAAGEQISDDLTTGRAEVAGPSHHVVAAIGQRASSRGGNTKGEPSHTATPARAHRWLMLIVFVATAILGTAWSIGLWP